MVRACNQSAQFFRVILLYRFNEMFDGLIADSMQEVAYDVSISLWTIVGRL